MSSNRSIPKLSQYQEDNKQNNQKLESKPKNTVQNRTSKWVFSERQLVPQAREQQKEWGY